MGLTAHHRSRLLSALLLLLMFGCASTPVCNPACVLPQTCKRERDCGMGNVPINCKDVTWCGAKE